MRVLHVTSTFPKRTDDPTGPFLADLVAAEQAAGLDVRVLAPHAPGLEVDGEVAGVPVHRFRYGPTAGEVLAHRGGLLAASRSVGGAAMVPAYLASMIAATAAQVRRMSPDVVHAHWWFPAGAAVSLSGCLSGLPFVVTLHGSDVGLAARPVLRSVSRVVLRRAAVVVAVSDALAAEAAAITGLPPSDLGVAVMPVVVDEGLTSRPRPRLDRGVLRLVAVGRLAPEKGFDVLIDALAIIDRLGLPGDTTSVVLDVVGAGPEGPELVRQAAVLGDRVSAHFHAPMARPALHGLIASADALVVPSRREGLGLVAIEAVLLGTPVVASAVGGLCEALGAPGASLLAGGTGRAGVGGGADIRAVPGGLLVPPGEASVLVRALRRAPGLARPSGAALTGAARHSPAAVAERHARLYERAARDR